MCPLKIDIFTLNALISTNKVSMFKLAIEVFRIDGARVRTDRDRARAFEGISD